MVPAVDLFVMKESSDQTFGKGESGLTYRCDSSCEMLEAAIASFGSILNAAR